MFGRYRRLPDLKSESVGKRNGAERQCINAPIQGTGSDCTLLSLININNELKRRNLKSMIVASVHDSIVFDIYIPELAEVAEMVKYQMENCWKKYIDTEVPVRSDLELGKAYGSVFEVELEECMAIHTVEDFEEWNHKQKIAKYTKEINTLKDKGWTVEQIKKWLISHNRPINELENLL